MMSGGKNSDSHFAEDTEATYGTIGSRSDAITACVAPYGAVIGRREKRRSRGAIWRGYLAGVKPSRLLWAYRRGSRHKAQQALLPEQKPRPNGVAENRQAVVGQTTESVQRETKTSNIKRVTLWVNNGTTRPRSALPGA